MLSMRSPPNSIFRAFLYLALSGAVAADSFPCKFALSDLEFDLCPILSGPTVLIPFAEDTPPTHTTHEYSIGMGGPLRRDLTLPAELQVCQFHTPE
jgi:hypothetical protein